MCAVVVAALALTSLYLAYYSDAGETITGALQFGAAKLILLGVAYYALILCSRQYSAAKHNAVVNRHKQLALRTFETFFQGSSSTEAKDAIIQRAASAVFEHQESGYLKNQPAATNPLQQFIEISTKSQQTP